MCPKCHYKLEPHQKYCPKCGARVEDHLQFDQEKWNSIGQQREMTGSASHRHLFVPLLTLSIVIFCLGLLVLTIGIKQQTLVSAPPATEPPATEETSFSDLEHSKEDVEISSINSLPTVPPINEYPESTQTEAPQPDFEVNIYYNANGGNENLSTIQAQVFDHVMTFVHSQHVPVRTGYTFSGWRYENDPNSAIDSPGQTITFGDMYDDAPITYYACWQKESSSPSNRETASVTEPKEAYISTGELKIRSGPGTTFDEVGRLYYLNDVVITEQKTDSSGMHWGKIETGWICLDNGYVTFGDKVAYIRAVADGLQSYTGNWGDRVGQRAHGQIFYDGSFLQCSFQWANSASDGYEWEFSGTYDHTSGQVFYTNGTRRYWKTSEVTGEIEYTIEYTGSTGKLYLQNGELYWDDDIEDSDSRCIFEKL